jgi:hypothetical protein
MRPLCLPFHRQIHEYPEANLFIRNENIFIFDGKGKISMSLTSIMRSGFSGVVNANIPIPKDKFKSSKDCVACPRTKNYSLIGTSFDYLLRSELKRLHPNAIENGFVAGNSIALVEGEIKINGYFQARNKRIGKKELLAMKSAARKYQEERSLFIENGILDDSFVEATIRFARMDVVFRAGIYDDIEKDVDPLDIEDMRALYNLIPDGFRNQTSIIMLDPTFGYASEMVGGADVDLILGDAMIDIKTTKEMKLDEYIWSQIVGYLMLADHALETEKGFPLIESLGLYFSRYGYLWKIEADFVRKNPNYGKIKKELLKYWLRTSESR